MHVLKGHGTENDFVLVPDLDGELDLTVGLVRALCDRRAGIGADGVLRVVRSGNDPDGKEFADAAEFFMDYRNADGSIAEMCGNGVRVFVRYLQRVGLVGDDAAVATRGGIKRVRTGHGGVLAVEMGQPRILADRPVVTAALGLPPTPGRAIELPNPHVVIDVASAESLAGLDLTRAPTVAPRPDFPGAGQNVEFVARIGPRHLVMRVHERGVGETRSCGTGVCAAVVAAATGDGTGPDGVAWRVDVPGGSCSVTWGPVGLILSGPAVIVAELELDEHWLTTAEAT